MARPATLPICLACVCSALVGADSDPTVDLHGFVSQGYLKSNRNNYLGESQRGSFDFNEAGLEASATVAPNLRAGLQLFARDLGDLGNDRVGLDWAYADYRLRDWLGVRAGRVRMALGLYNETRDLDLARTAALLPQSVYPEAFRDVTTACNGGELYGHANLDRLGALDYVAYVGSQNIDAQDSSIAQISNDTGFSTLTAIENKYTTGASLFWNTPLSGLRLGGSYSYAEHVIHGVTTAIPPFVPSVAFTSKVDLGIYVASLEYTYDDLTIASEFERLDGHVTPSIASAPRVRLDNGGAYLSVEYRLMKQVQVGGYVSDYHTNLPDHANRDPSTYQRDYALTCRFDITDNWLFKLEGHWIRGYAQLLKQDNFAPGGGPFGHKDAETDWLLFVAKTSVNF